MRDSGPDAASRSLSLVELLTLLGVIAGLALLVPPFLLAGAASESRARCQDNLKALSLATNVHAMARNGFPPATYYAALPNDPQGRNVYASVHSRLLPDLGRQELFDSINFAVPMSSLVDFPVENTTATRVELSMFACPVDRNRGVSPYRQLNYRANVGLGELGLQPRFGTMVIGPRIWTRGTFDPMRTVPFSEFTDGLSGTVAFAEKLAGSGTTGFDPARDWVPAAAPEPSTSAEDWVRICSNLPAQASARGRTDSGRCWMLAGALFSTFQGELPPNSTVPDCGADALNGVGAFGPRSLHPGGVNVAMADGSVLWMRSSISPRRWSSLLTRSAGEIGDESF